MFYLEQCGGGEGGETYQGRSAKTAQGNQSTDSDREAAT